MLHAPNFGMSEYLGKPAPLFPNVRVVFTWAYKMEREAWIAKEDSTQYMIRRLSQVFDVYVAVVGPKSECWPYANATYIACPTISTLHTTALTLAQCHKGPVVYVLNSYEPFDRRLVNESPDRSPYPTKFIAYCHGRDVVAWHGAVDAHLVCTEHQRRINNDGTRYVIMPHSPDMGQFYPGSDAKQWDVFYPARRDENKRVELLEEACRLGGFSLKILDGATANDRHRRGMREVEKGGMGAMYRKARVLASTSHSEGGSRILIEAMSSNTPCVVCADCRNNVDYVRRFGGYVAQPNARSIADTIGAAIQRPPLDTRSVLLREGVYYQGTYATFRRVLREIGIQ